jgi:hypothetical protein
MAEEKNLAALGVLEEDDEFEEFAAEGLSEWLLFYSRLLNVYRLGRRRRRPKWCSLLGG